MDRYVVPRSSPPPQKQKPFLRRPRWKMFAAELDGRLLPKHQHQLSGPLIESYAEVAEFPHHYKIGDEDCPTHKTCMPCYVRRSPVQREGVSGMEFDNKGIYLASVTKSGCLMIHDFETLYSLSNGPSRKEDETKHLLHLTPSQQLNVVRWNPASQNEVACASLRSGPVLLFDIGYISSEALEVLKPRPSLNVHGYQVIYGISDITFTPAHKSRVLASDQHGVISVWDRRLSHFPCLELRTNSQSTINSIQLNVEDQIIYGANSQGIIYAWDLRGGRTSVAFQSVKEVHYPPLMTVKLASQLEKITSLKAQSNIVPREIHSINLDPSCPYQLAFHLDDGWSGVFNVHSLQVTHMHCPPPTWLDDKDMLKSSEYTRKPTWFPTCSIYAVGSSSGDGIHLLDFYPDTSSACHVDFIEESEQQNQRVHNRFIPLAKSVTICAAHPLNGTIIAGTKHSSLLMISQRQKSCSGDCDERG
eukprot:TRINITY_DN12324_c0_g1_i8.p1 TRINITY_DN12324_c0_g1~~TRINITY_DN12324_c0_g1_i8.p1  ORF type:complete len:474 (-),score=73.00 TRINITY_DN12324_c0_g1_i8:293-1714(-)